MKMKAYLSKSLVISLLALCIVGCSSVPVYMISWQAESYFVTPDTEGKKWESLGNGLYSYQHWIDRSLIIDTPEGIVVIESFNEEMAGELKQILDEKFPGKPVKLLVYSHQHLDHTRGGHVLKPLEVIAHKNTRWHFDHYSDDEVLKPTRYIDGSTTMIFGQHRVEFIDFEHGHAEHLYGFYIAEEKLLYGPDLAFCEALFPFGFPDFNHYGHVEALDQAANLDFNRFISSHFNSGDKSCVTGTRDFFNDTREAVLNGFEEHGLPSDNGTAKWFRSIIGDTKGALDDKYGDWHGYDEMSLPFILRQASGAYLGF